MKEYRAEEIEKAIKRIKSEIPPEVEQVLRFYDAIIIEPTTFISKDEAGRLNFRKLAVTLSMFGGEYIQKYNKFVIPLDGVARLLMREEK